MCTLHITQFSGPSENMGKVGICPHQLITGVEIQEEHTLLLNEGIPRAYRGKKLCLKNILFFPSKSEGITLRILMEVPAKSECKMPSDF